MINMTKDETVYGAKELIRETPFAKSRIIVCKECVDYKCPNGMDMICALWNEEVFPDHFCEWGKHK